jgi:hypothetical protein
MELCPKCKLPVPSNEAAAYNGRHENCAVGLQPAAKRRSASRLHLEEVGRPRPAAITLSQLLGPE